jgi:hypothetical protein
LLFLLKTKEAGFAKFGTFLSKYNLRCRSFFSVSLFSLSILSILKVLVIKSFVACNLLGCSPAYGV